MAPSNRRKIGILNIDSFHRIRVHLTGAKFLIQKIRDTQVKLGASNASSHSTWLMMMVMGQKITLLVIVKKKMVLKY